MRGTAFGGCQGGGGVKGGSFNKVASKLWKGTRMIPMYLHGMYSAASDSDSGLQSRSDTSYTGHYLSNSKG